MSYSDYDSDGYQSHEDEDYVPSDDNLSEDDMNECEKEEPLHEEDSVPQPGRKKKRKDAHMRKHRKSEEEGKERANPPQAADEDETTQKKKSDDLWASFLSDVGSRHKAPAAECPSRKQEISFSSLQPQASSAEMKTSQSDKVVITKVFDFAGEEVRVSKEVSADSREARTYLKNQKAEEEEDAGNPNKPPVSESPLPGASTKRPSGMSSILSRIGGKKPKMSTLEKSKMDWDAFKSEEGITEELAIHNRGKEGFVERKNFLERVDHRQFELEKAVRLSNMKP